MARSTKRRKPMPQPTQQQAERVCERRVAGEHPTAIAADMRLDLGAVQRLCADVDMIAGGA